MAVGKGEVDLNSVTGPLDPKATLPAGPLRALGIVPRLVVGLTGGVERPPTGVEVWDDTRLILPGVIAGKRFRNLFTEEVLEADGSDGERSLVLAEVCSRFPVALLDRVRE